jgi:hypothetical protein
VRVGYEWFGFVFGAARAIVLVIALVDKAQ